MNIHSLNISYFVIFTATIASISKFNVFFGKPLTTDVALA